MARFTVTHEIACNVEAFWKLFLDQTFNEKFYREGLHFDSWKILEQTEDEKFVRRKVTGQPKMKLPGPVMKLMGSNFAYTEVGTFDKAAQVWRWNLTPSVLADRVKQEGAVRVEALPNGKVRRVADLMIEAKIFGLGGMIESSVEKELREGWDDSARYMNQYIANMAK